MTRKFIKPVVVVSQCLEFDKCRYNGAVIPTKLVKKLNRHVKFLPVCPEVEIGLGVPRDPIKLVERDGRLRLVQPSTNSDLTKKMQQFSKAYLKSLGPVDGFILKFASPSCGLKDAKVYPADDQPIAKSKGPGMFAAQVLEHFPGLAIEDEGRLNNFIIREHFLTKLFILSDFRSVRQSGRVNDLVKFHSRNKLMLMAYNQKHLKVMGRLVANESSKSMAETYDEYEKNLHETFMRLARYTSHINVLMHAMGYFKEVTTSGEKKYFLDMLQNYRNEILPVSAVISVLKGWIIKYNSDYLMSQTYFNPYPEELIEITDSGRGRNKRY